jgi:hypothetical protein
MAGMLETGIGAGRLFSHGDRIGVRHPVTTRTRAGNKMPTISTILLFVAVTMTLPAPGPAVVAATASQG